jgi:hypothetical protein
MEHQALQLSEELEPAKVELDEEDQQELLCDCHGFLAEILDRKNPQWLQAQGLKLLDRLTEVLSWHKIH